MPVGEKSIVVSDLPPERICANVRDESQHVGARIQAADIRLS